MRRFWFALIIGLVGIPALLAAWTLGTTAGSRWFTHELATRLLRASHVESRQAQGNLLRGLTLRGVRATASASTAWGAVLTADELTIAPVHPAHPTAWALALKRLRCAPHPTATAVTVERLEAARGASLIAHDVLVQNVRWLPGASVVEIQRVDVAWPWRASRVERLHNGRLRLPYLEPIVFSGTQQDGRLSLQLLTNSVDVATLLKIVGQPHLAERFSGTLKEINLSLEGSWETFAVHGDLFIEHVSRTGFTLQHCPVTVAVEVKDVTTTPVVKGPIVFGRGTVQGPQSSVELSRSTVTFTGDPRNPALELQGTSTIGSTTIHLTLKGTADEPALRLSSDPPMGEPTLLAMVVTGKRWQGAQDVLTGGTMGSDLAVDFLDYFVFGGRGGRLARRLGISELAITHDADANRVGLRTTLGDRVKVGVEVEPTSTGSQEPAEASGGPLLPYKVGAEYQVTDQTSVALEGERTLPPTRHPSTSSEPSTSIGDDAVQTNDQVLLKVKRRF